MAAVRRRCVSFVVATTTTTTGRLPRSSRSEVSGLTRMSSACRLVSSGSNRLALRGKIPPAVFGGATIVRFPCCVREDQEEEEKRGTPTQVISTRESRSLAASRRSFFSPRQMGAHQPFNSCIFARHRLSAALVRRYDDELPVAANFRPLTRLFGNDLAERRSG